MKTTLRKSIAFLLTFAIILSVCVTGLASSAQVSKTETASEVLTSCGGNCANCPSIVIPGLFQSQTRMYDESGNMVLDDDGDPITQLMVLLSKKDIVKMAFKLIGPLFASLILQKNIRLSDTVAKIAADVLDGNAKDNEGKHINNIDVIKYKKSVARCTEEEKKRIYNTIPLSDYSKVAGEDHMYFFAYDSFGSISDIADELYALIQQVKAETGHSKVNLVPISQGGSITNELLERYKSAPYDIAADLNRVIYIVPALNGAMLISEIFKGNFIKDDDMLYGRLFPMLMESDQQWLAYLVNILIRVLPKDVVYAILDDTVASLVDTLLVNCTCMWALSCNEDFDTLAAKYLSDGSRPKIKNEVEFFHRAQTNRISNVLEMKARGVEFFDVVDYDYALYPLFSGWDEYNADGIINTSSESFGAVTAPVGEKLPDGYTPAGTYCTCGNSSKHISPDGTVDASAGALCETTFYFKGQDHEKTGQNDVVMRLAVELLLNEGFTSVHSRPNDYPQFNTGRLSREMRRSLLPDAKSIDQSKLSEADRNELNAAIADCEAVLAQTNVDIAKFNAAQDRITAILIKLGYRTPAKEESKAMSTVTYILKFISNAIYMYLGPRGFSDIIFGRHASWTC